MKSTFLVWLLLSASKAFSDNQPRQLGGDGNPTPVDDKSTLNAEAERRDLNWHGKQNVTRAFEGKRSLNSRIVGGFEADDGEYKFIATLNVSLPDEKWTLCGGSLIAPDIVLTAAHCGIGFVDSVRIGSNSLGSGGDLRVVASQCAHPMFEASDKYFANDFMLIKLDSPVDTSVYPIIQLNQDPSLPQEDDMLTVIGFGATTSKGNASQTLQKVEVPMNSYELCNQQNSGGIEEDIQFCAGYVEGGKDYCQGDSGGPIFEMRGSTPVQMGVVSFGTGCAEPDLSGVYARITGAYEWINNTMAKLEASDATGCGGVEATGSSGDDDDSVNLNDDDDDDDVDGGDDGGLRTGMIAMAVVLCLIFFFLLISYS